jgi:peptidyl-prolyl cis-trans isomerase B (cyclophilin B)
MRLKNFLTAQTCVVLSLVSLTSACVLTTASVPAAKAAKAEKADSEEKAEKVSKEFKGDPIAVFETTKGTIRAELYKDLAPKTVENFVGLANKKFYDGLTFHRYVGGFCIQGGDPEGTGMGGSGTTIPLETNPRDAHTRHNAPGVLAMARSANPNSASSQFYFALDKQPGLDNPPDGGPGYAVFGRTLDSESLKTVLKLRKGDKMIKVYIEK